MTLTTKSAVAGGAIGVAAGLAVVFVLYRAARPRIIDGIATGVRDAVPGATADLDEPFRSVARQVGPPLASIMAGIIRRVLEQELP